MPSTPAKDKIQNYVTFDFETGGYDPNKNPITQVCALANRSDDYSEIAVYTEYCQVYNDLFLEPQALAATGITREMIDSGVKINEIVDNLCEVFTKANTGGHHTKKPILIGHNVLFDINYLDYIFYYCKRDLSKFVQGKVMARNYFLPYFLDTMHLARAKWPTKDDIPNHQLGTCCQKAGVDLFNAHDAEGDTRATFELFTKLNSMDSSNSGETVSSKKKFRESYQI